MRDFLDGVIAGYCQRRAVILSWRRQRLLCIEANARYRVRLRAALRKDESSPF